MTPRNFLAWIFAGAIASIVCLSVVLVFFDVYQGAFPRLASLTRIDSPLGQSLLIAGIAAIPATIVVILLQATRGQLEFSILGMKFKGPSGPVTLWALIFLVVAGVILGALAATSESAEKIELSRLEAESVLQRNRGNIELCVSDIPDAKYLNFFFSWRKDGGVGVDVLLGEGKKITRAQFWHTHLPGGVYSWPDLVNMLKSRQEKPPITEPPPEVDVSKRLFFASENMEPHDQHGYIDVIEYGSKLSVKYPKVNQCIIETVKDSLNRFMLPSPQHAFLHKYITTSGQKI